MQQWIDIAGEFIKLAATLCYLKVVNSYPITLPLVKSRGEDNPITIRERLAQQLKEYQGLEI